ncbi:MFS transporter [soil metagenome]
MASPSVALLKDRLKGAKLVRVLSYPDFRLLWIGAFLSFTGSWVQRIAQGYYVYSITHDEAKLGIVSFASSFPIFLFGFVAGSFADSFDKRKVLILAQILLGSSAFVLAYTTWRGTATFELIVVMAVFVGLVGCVETPTRQSIVSRVVPPEDLAAAVPVNAMTFNVARIFGPAIGGFLLANIGVAPCYLVDGISFFALIWAANAIRADLGKPEGRKQPVRDLIFEGALYTWREARLRALLILETLTACFGIFYIPLIPAYVVEELGYSEQASKAGIAYCYTSIGIGGLLGLVLITALSDSPHKGRIVRWSMIAIGTGLMAISFIHSPFVAYPAMAVIGGATIMQFNTTNALFQLLSPERLRGRVLSMHIWALNGLSPFGTLGLAWLAHESRTFTWQGPRGVALSLVIGGSLVLVGAGYAWTQRHLLRDLGPRGESPSLISTTGP